MSIEAKFFVGTVVAFIYQIGILCAVDTLNPHTNPSPFSVDHGTPAQADEDLSQR